MTAVIEKSPESARLIVLGSASFLADQTVRMIGSADGTIYTGSLELMANIVDWAVEGDQSLLGIRGRGHFNRTLDPMSEDQQRVWEYANYALALAGLAVVFVNQLAAPDPERTRLRRTIGDLVMNDTKDFQQDHTGLRARRSGRADRCARWPPGAVRWRSQSRS